ncbi:sulfatase [Poritiphilus flavus]|uniref:Sulfatase-like hydrolase/transferase n=1 Tax=Poritiphilus flavus TaxID=2697053 RepID=A0A6L9EGI3_9FLAO|nr:sulfatase [Poritiphilus flavus]NAS13864.1 sulfatase-like hydrolase/transferase [Poritiphilus flavus]
MRALNNFKYRLIQGKFRGLFSISLGFLFSLLFINCKKEVVVQKPNILLICVDDLRPELRSFGAEYIISPNIDRLAQSGISFRRHYVNAPSCGPSRYTLLTGLYGPRGNDALFRRSVRLKQGKEHINPSMPEWFRTHGYTAISVGKVSHHPGGMGGADWNDSTQLEMPRSWDKQLMPSGPWKHPRGAMHGLAHGEIRVKPKEMDVYQAVEGDDSIYPDGLIAKEALKQIKDLSKEEKPFFLAVGLIKPHLPFGAPKAYLDLYDSVQLPDINHPGKPEGRTTWHGSGEFRQYNLWGSDPNEDPDFAVALRRHYAACVSYADAQVGKILEELKRIEADKNTIVVLWGDHGWHLGEHAVWGKHTLFEESLHSPLIIQYPDIKLPGAETDAIVETLDLFPTLCDLSGIAIPDFVQGSSLRPMMEDPQVAGNPAIAYHSKATTIRNSSHRLILHKDGYTELYDHDSSEKETRNVAEENPELVEKLTQELRKRLE